MIRGTDGGLLLQNFSVHGSGLELWSPGSVPRALPFAPSWVDGFGASARLVEYATGCISRQRLDGRVLRCLPDAADL